MGFERAEFTLSYKALNLGCLSLMGQKAELGLQAVNLKLCGVRGPSGWEPFSYKMCMCFHKPKSIEGLLRYPGPEVKDPWSGDFRKPGEEQL